MTPLGRQPSWLRIVFVVLLFSVTILALGLALLFYFGDNRTQGKFIDAEKYQAVFLSNGQVYFGQVKDVNHDYIDLRDIFYLNSTDSTDKTATDANKKSELQLKKLGCELHRPTDQMVINRDQVTFWENIQSDGNVASAIAQWKKTNPKGQKCTTTSSSTQQSDTTAPTSTTTDTPDQSTDTAQ